MTQNWKLTSMASSLALDGDVLFAIVTFGIHLASFFFEQPSTTNVPVPSFVQ